MYEFDQYSAHWILVTGLRQGGLGRYRQQEVAISRVFIENEPQKVLVIEICT